MRQTAQRRQHGGRRLPVEQGAIERHHPHVMMLGQVHGQVAVVAHDGDDQPLVVCRNGSEHGVLAAGTAGQQDGRRPGIAAQSHGVGVEQMATPAPRGAPLMA
ncbi:MAG: hypothetical protein R2748_12435 [Bryobacterales bacterium]